MDTYPEVNEGSPESSGWSPEVVSLQRTVFTAVITCLGLRAFSYNHYAVNGQ